VWVGVPSSLDTEAFFFNKMAVQSSIIDISISTFA
jgi:hypothetical protein